VEADKEFVYPCFLALPSQDFEHLLWREYSPGSTALVGDDGSMYTLLSQFSESFQAALHPLLIIDALWECCAACRNRERPISIKKYERYVLHVNIHSSISP